VNIIHVADRTFERFMEYSGSLFECGITWPSRTAGRVLPNGSRIIDLGKTKKLPPTPSAHDKRCQGKTCICRIKRSNKAAMVLLRRVDDHFEYTGLRGFGYFDNPMGARRMLNKAIRSIRRKWVPPQPTRRKKLKKYYGLAPRKRRTQHAERMLVFTKTTVRTMRAAVKNLYGQGFLAKTVTIYPYTPADTFNLGHKVNVYRDGTRFDVIDSLCNIPILAGLTRHALKKVVHW
jgi:hypothetical protein